MSAAAGDIKKTKKGKSGGFQSMGLSEPVLQGVLKMGALASQAS